MPRTRYHAAQFGGSADEVEVAFYEALQQGDLEQLMACWADEDDIFCIHPGGPRVVGASAIRATFEAMFVNGGAIRAFPQAVRKVASVASCVHNVVERVEVLTPEGPQNGWVIATNVYHRTAHGWRLVAHHASPGTTHDVQEIAGSPTVLH